MAGPTTLPVAAVQLCANADRATNLAAADRLVREAAARGARLVLLPEKWPLYSTGAEMRAGAEGLDGEIAGWARDCAAELGIELVAGSFNELAEDGAIHNTSLHISPRGEIRASYRKIHMFDVTVDGVEYRESDDESAGDEIVVTRTDDGVELGMTICYDLRFPHVHVCYGEPMVFEAEPGAPRERQQEIADAIFARIRELYARQG